MTNLEKIKKHGYKGADNPFAIFMWIIIEKNLYPNIYFSLFDKKWHIDNHIIDTKNAKWLSWNHVEKGFDTYKEAVMFIVDVIIKML